MQRAAAARADLALDVDDHLIARQVRRQDAVVAPWTCSVALLPLSVRSRGVLRRLARGNGLLQVLKPKRQLVGVELLGPPSELLAQQLLDQRMHPPKAAPLKVGG